MTSVRELLEGGVSTRELLGEEPTKVESPEGSIRALLEPSATIEAPTTEVPMAPDIHPATTYLEKFTKPSPKEFDRLQMAPLITKENVQPAMDSLGRLWNLAQHPYDVVRGAAVFASEIPGFIGGLASAIGTIPMEVLKGGTMLDWYNASATNMQTITNLWHRGVSAPLDKLLRTPEEMGKELSQTMFGAEPETHKDESELIGEIAMVPLTVVSGPLHELSESPTFDNHPNVKGALKFSADALGVLSMGMFYKGGPVAAAKDLGDVAKKASDIDAREKSIDLSNIDEVLKTAQKKLLNIEKVQLELEIKRMEKKLDHEKLAKKDLEEKGREVEVIRESRLKYAEERAKEGPTEPKPKIRVKLTKKMPAKVPIAELKDTKLVDREGKPKTVYHSTDAVFDKFDNAMMGTVTDHGYYGRGFYFSNEPRTAYGKNVIPAHLDIKKPLRNVEKIFDELANEMFPGVENFSGKQIDAIELRIVDRAKEKGYDGIIAGPEYVVFDASQIHIRPPEPITDLDYQTGLREPVELSTDNSPFRDTPERTQAMKKVYEERANSVKTDPELLTNKLLNDVNRWLDGEDLPIEGVRNNLSEMAARAEELENTFREGVNFIRWKDTISNAANWARNADRSKFERTEPTTTLESLGGQQLYETVIREGKKFVKLYHATSPDIFKIIKEEGFKDLNIYDIANKAIELSGFSKNRIGEVIEFLKENYLDPDRPISEGRGIYFSANKERVSGEGVVLQEGMLNALHAISQIDKGEIGRKAKEIENRIETGPRKIISVEVPFEEAKIISGEALSNETYRGDINLTIDQANKYLDRSKIEQTLPSVDLNIMVPIDAIPEAVRSFLSTSKQFAKRIFGDKGFFVRDVYRNKELFDKTGFWVGKDGFWRYEIDDSKAKFHVPKAARDFYTSGKVTHVTLSEILDYPELYKVFPDIKNTEVYFDRSVKSEGEYGGGVIRLKRIGDRSSLLHELQHAINDRMGAFPGTSVERAGLKAYKKTPGEMEARLVETRSGFTMEERKKEPPWVTLDRLATAEHLGKEAGPTLYSGLPLDEAVKQLKKMAKPTGEFMKEFRNSFKEKEFDFAHAVKQIKADTVRSLSDQSETLLKMIREQYPQEYERIVTRQRSAVTGIGYGKVLYGQAVKEIYGGKSKEMVEVINAYVLARRFADIYGYRSEKGYKHQPGYGSAETVSTSAIIEMIKDIPSGAWKIVEAKVPEIKKLFGDLTSAEIAEVVKAGDAYFEWSRKIVDDLVEAGIKSPEEGAQLKSHDFRKFKTMLIKKLYDFNYDLDMKGETIKVTSSGVEPLGIGSTKIIEPDARVVLSEQMARAYGSIAHQKAVLEWKSLATKHLDNGFVSVKKQSGWSPMPYMDNGVKKNIYFHPDAIKYLVTRSRDLSPRLAMAIRVLTMAPVTRTLAVGVSPIWSTLSGLPMDVMHSLWTARTWEADAKGIRPKATFPFYETREGKFKKVYSPFAGVDALQIGHDMKRVLSDVYNRGPLTTNLMKHGLVMNFLTQRQNRYMKGVKPPGDYAKMMDLLSYHGLTTELWIRIATADRVIRKGAKERGITYEEALKNKDIMYRAAHAGRDRMDYNQGGWLIKALDQSGMIFLNAAFLGGRTFWRQAIDNPVDFTFRAAQLGITAAGVTAAAWSLYPETMKDMSDQGSGRDVKWPIAPDWLKVKDIDGNDVSFHFKMRMDPSAAFMYRVFEGLTRTYMYDQGLTDVEPDYRRLTEQLKKLGPVDVKLPPLAQAWVDYKTNYSWWADRQMYTELGGRTFDWPQSQYEGMYDPRVPQMAKDVAKVTKLSPTRGTGAISNIIPFNNEFVWLTGKAYEIAHNDLPKEVREQHWLLTLAETPGFNKVIGITRHGRGRWKVKSDIENEIELERMVMNSKFDMLATQNAWYGVKNEEKLTKFMKEQESDVYDDMIDTLKFIKNPMVKTLPHRNFWLSMRHMSVRGRAKTWAELLDRSNESGKKQLLNELSQVMEIGGVVTPKFMEEVEKLRESGY